MPRRDADRNLLFGILALQMDFVSRDPLIAAMNAWVLDKRGSLGELLVARGSLDPDDLALLEPTVDRHIARHGDDPEGAWPRQPVGLAPRDARPDRRPRDPPASPRERPLDRGRPRTDPDLRRVGAPPGNGRYRKIRDHAKGGLGEVFVAHDEELNREVALKEIQDRHADDPQSRARFVLEAEITGGLEHPGIVPVYGLGHYADGRPFYAMRFIQGDSLKDAIERVPRGRAAAAATRASGRWSCASCSAGSSTSATRSPTPTAGACCTAT